jgi:hypothetical protein
MELVQTLDRDLDVVISGGCRGVDTWAAEEARRLGIPVVEHLPILTTSMSYGQRVAAYYQRNAKIAYDCDVLYAFAAADRRGGTENTIKWALKAGIPVKIL